MGVLNYWAFLVGGWFVLMMVGSMYMGCSKVVEGFGLGSYTCNELESDLQFDINIFSIQMYLILVIIGTVFDRKMDFIKVCGPIFITILVFFAHWVSKTINGHTMSHGVYFMHAFVFGTFVIAAYAHKDSAGVAKSETMQYGALNYWTLGVGGTLSLLFLASLCGGCSKAIEAWGGGEYSCNGLESGMAFNSDLTKIGSQLVAMMCATITVRKLDLIKLAAPGLIVMPVMLAFCPSKIFNGQCMPNSVSYLSAIIWGGFIVAAIMHPGSTASARQMQTTGKAPLLSA